MPTIEVPEELSNLLKIVLSAIRSKRDEDEDDHHRKLRAEASEWRDQ